MNLDKHEKNTRLHKNILNNIDSYFLWGKKIIQVIKEYLEDTKKIFVFMVTQNLICLKKKYSILQKRNKST